MLGVDRAQNGGVGSSDVVEFCSFTKAIEHLGDRWSLLVVREIGVFGPQGFNTLARGLPGRISTSVLTERVRRLESLGVITHDDGETGSSRYRLTAAGEALLPIIMGLRGWAAAWIPDDPAMLERDPDIVLAWLVARVDRTAQPHPRAIIEIWSGRHEELRAWLILEAGTEPYGCHHDPLLEQQRYLLVRLGPEVLLALARGQRAWTAAVADGSVRVTGDPALIRDLAGWFSPAPAPASHRIDTTQVMT